jgi:hypothetical protein
MKRKRKRETTFLVYLKGDGKESLHAELNLIQGQIKKYASKIRQIMVSLKESYLIDLQHYSSFSSFKQDCFLTLC